MTLTILAACPNPLVGVSLSTDLFAAFVSIAGAIAASVAVGVVLAWALSALSRRWRLPLRPLAGVVALYDSDDD